MKKRHKTVYTNRCASSGDQLRQPDPHNDQVRQAVQGAVQVNVLPGIPAADGASEPPSISRRSSIRGREGAKTGKRGRSGKTGTRRENGDETGKTGTRRETGTERFVDGPQNDAPDHCPRLRSRAFPGLGMVSKTRPQFLVARRRGLRRNRDFRFADRCQSEPSDRRLRVRSHPLSSLDRPPPPVRSGPAGRESARHHLERPAPVARRSGARWVDIAGVRTPEAPGWIERVSPIRLADRVIGCRSAGCACSAAPRTADTARSRPSDAASRPASGLV